jgi:hypothetical protein
MHYSLTQEIEMKYPYKGLHTVSVFIRDTEIKLDVHYTKYGNNRDEVDVDAVEDITGTQDLFPLFSEFYIERINDLLRDVIEKEGY